MAHLLLLSFGSSGDFNSLLWLGRLLKLRGHQVSMIANGEFEAAARRADLGFYEAGTKKQYEEAIQDENLWKAGKGTQLALESAAWCTDSYLDAAERALKENEPPKLMLALPLVFAARLLREKFGIPLITVQVVTLGLMSSYETPLLDPRLGFFSRMPRWFKRMILALPSPVDFITRGLVRKACIKNGVEPPNSVWREWWNSPDGVLALFPAWFYAAQPDWPPNCFQWDFPLEDLASEHSLPDELVCFIEEGGSFVVFTPGSFNVHAHRFFESGAAAVKQLGLRAVFVTRAAEQVPAGLPESIITVAYAAFSTLLKRAAAFVHHGGPGTLAQGFAAGVPQLVMPMVHEQHDSAQRLERLGAGLSLNVAEFTPERVTEALHRLLKDQSIHHAAQRCADLIRGRPETETLLAWIESHFKEVKEQTK